MIEIDNPFKVQKVGQLIIVTQAIEADQSFVSPVHDEAVIKNCLVTAFSALGGPAFVGENLTNDPEDLKAYRDFLLFLEEKKMINPGASAMAMGNIEANFTKNNNFLIEFFNRRLIHARCHPRVAEINPLEMMLWGPEDIPALYLKRAKEIRDGAGLEERLKLPEESMLAMQMMFSLYDQVSTAIHYLTKGLVKDFTITLATPDTTPLPKLPGEFQLFVYRDDGISATKITLTRHSNDTLSAVCYYDRMDQEATIQTQLTAFGYFALVVALNAGIPLREIQHVFTSSIESLELHPYATIVAMTGDIHPDNLSLEKLPKIHMTDLSKALEDIAAPIEAQFNQTFNS